MFSLLVDLRHLLKREPVCAVVLPADVIRDLQSPNENVRAKAVRALCPCRNGWDGFERHLEWAHKLTKDPSPLVRAAALHIFEDAAQMQSDGLPTNPRETNNEMLRTRRAFRFARDATEEDAAGNNKASEKQRTRHNKSRRGSIPF